MRSLEDERGSVVAARRFAVAMAVTLLLVGCDDEWREPHEKPDASPEDGGMADAEEDATEPAPDAESPPFKLVEATIDDIQRAIKKGEITCKQLVQAYIDRIAAYNGPCTQLVTADG